MTFNKPHLVRFTDEQYQQLKDLLNSRTREEYPSLTHLIRDLVTKGYEVLTTKENNNDNE